mmetsp:Transcript_66250/g.132928  ORF Transcript_66250/g.132928 Transcript_66250/m.132928 type:complete len:456 (-) Transcript_66250:149-1516(-)
MVAWETSLSEAEAALNGGKFFDGVQYINSCMEEYGKEIDGDAGGKLVKEPEEFLAAVEAKLTPDQQKVLQRMFEVRGDIITGLGANKRAAVDYACAQRLGADTTEVVEKKAKAEEATKQAKKSDKVPVTVITGFLGSGKTTLLNRILKEHHGKRIAVIENEFGEVGIDDELLEAGPMTTAENIVEMNNGCICCTVRGDLIAGLKKMVKNSDKTGKRLDGVMIETTGLADPAPVAQTFFADDFIQKRMSLDGILTVVDAQHIIQHLDEEKPEGVENEAIEQVAFADRILLNKCDLVDEAALGEVERRIRMINESVQIRRCVKSEVDMNYILGIEAFSLDKVLEMDDAFLEDNQDHQHDDRVSSVGIHVQGEVDQTKLNDWIGWLLKEKGVDLFRTKGVLAIQGMKEKFVFQAVHMAFSGAPQKCWTEGEERVCKLTFIGRHINREELLDGFTKCLA